MVSDKQRIMELEERLDKLESIINDFMKHYKNKEK